MKNANHLPALDGLRGLALLGVLAFHADRTLVGGYLGVDLFFVLSGFLITSLMLAEHGATGTIDLRAFWGRRARRLLPALMVLVLAVALAARPARFPGIRGDALATLGYVANWRQVFSAKNYWDLFLSPSPLEHMWSLAIEEQFYVVWPAVVLLALRAGGRRALLALTAALTVASAAAMVLLFNPANSSRAYFGTDTRAAAILAGAVLALVLPPRPAERGVLARRALDALGLTALAGTAWAWKRLDGANPWLYRGGFWLSELGALALIACARAGRASLVARVLSVRPLRLLGLVSYGAYLWHWPVHVFLTSGRARLHGHALEVVRLGVTLAIAAVSYRYLEKPIRERRFGAAHPVRLLAVSTAALVLVVAGVTSARPGARAHGPVPVHAGHARTRIAVHGDSTANSLGWVFVALQDPGVAVAMYGHDGFNLVRDALPAWPAPQDTAGADTTAEVIFLGGAFLYGIDYQRGWRTACHPEWHRRFEDGLTRWLAAAVERPRPLWMTTVPYALEQFDTPEYRARIDCVNRSIRVVMAAHPGVRLLELGEILCPRGTCPRESRDGTIRPDGVHYDPSASHEVGAAIVRALERAARP